MISRLFPVICLLVAVALFFGYINPTRTGSIAATNAQIASYDSALTAADQFKQKESQLVIARSNIPSDKLARLETFLPDGVDNVQIILDLNSLAARSGVTLSDFTTSSDAQSPGGSTAPSVSGAPTNAAGGIALESVNPVDSLDVTVSATGTYAAFHAFLAGIESSLRQLDVTNVAVKDSTTGVYTYKMTIRLYWLH